jgi:hypothetical protein
MFFPRLLSYRTLCSRRLLRDLLAMTEGVVGWVWDVVGVGGRWVQHGLGGGEVFRQRHPTYPCRIPAALRQFGKCRQRGENLVRGDFILLSHGQHVEHAQQRVRGLGLVP